MYSVRWGNAEASRVQKRAVKSTWDCIYLHSLNVILPGKDAADIWDEPLGGVESQNPHTMVTLQPQLKEDKLCVFFFFNDTAAQCLRYSWPTSRFKSHSTSWDMNMSMKQEM